MNFSFRKSNQKNKQRSRKRQKDYQKLEPRQLLAVEVGLNFTGASGGVDSIQTPPDTIGAVGPDHIVEMVNSRITVYDKTTGIEVETQTLDEFWEDAGADLDFSTTTSPRVLFDPTSGHWFASSVDQGIGNTIYIAVSTSDNPVGPWKSVQFIGDSGGNQIATFETLSVDANGVYMTSNNIGFTTDTSIYSIPKVDMLAITPTTVNMTKFEGLDPDVYGTTVQVALDYAPGATRAIAIGADADGGTAIYRTDIVGSFGPAAAIAPVVSITVPEYMPAPNGRQPSGVVIDNISPDFSGSIIRSQGSVWAVHSVAGSFGTNSAIRWYQINEFTNELTNWGTLEKADVDYLDPSIAVSEYGVVSIGYTATGPTMFPSAQVVMGYTTNGLKAPKVFFQEPATLRAGLANYEFSETSTNFWGRYSATQVDPTDPFSFWTFQEYANLNDEWSIRIAESGVIDLSPTLRGDDTDNVIIVRVSEDNSNWVEVEMDGTITDVFEKRGLTTLNIDAMGGNDTLILDYTYGNPNPNTGVTLRGGDGFDIVQVINGTAGNLWVVDGDGRGTIDRTARFRTIEQVTGSAFADSFLILDSPGTLDIRAGAGPDFFNVTKPVTGTLNLFGQAGDDSYRLALENVSGVNIVDSIGSESDRLITVATEGNDVIEMDGTTLTLNGTVENGFDFPGIETLGVDALGGDDQFYVRTTLQVIDLYGSGGQDQFFLSSAAPGTNGDTKGLFDVLNIDGGIDLNRIVIGAENNDPIDVSVTSNTIEGITDNGIGLINYVATDGSFAWNGGIAGITIVGTGFGDKFTVKSLLDENTLRVEAGAGIDTMEVFQNVQGNVDLDGQGGSDTYRVTMVGTTDRIITIPDSGGGDRDRIELGFTEGDDAVRVAHGFVRYFSEQLVYGFQMESLIMNTKGGNDVVELDQNDQDYIRLMTGFGDDVVDVVGSRGINSVRMELGDGNDMVNMEGSSSLTFFGIAGQTGNDVLNAGTLSFADIVFDGGENADTVNVNNVGRTNRYIDARDSGTIGLDAVNVVGVLTQDRFTLRPNSVVNRSEVVVFDESNESLVVDAGAGNDIIEVYGTKVPDTRVQMRSGNDLIFIHGTFGANNLIIDGGAGNDSVVAKATTVGTSTFVYGQGGDDLFSVGSSAADNNGNLSQIRGNLRFIGGDSVVEDRLLVNDHGATGTYGYFVNDSIVTSIVGGTSAARPEFAGVRFDGSMEFVRVDGTDQNNQFNVQPNANVRIHIDGNDEAFGGDSLAILGSGDGRQLFMTGAESGVWKFTNGFFDVSFEEIEIPLVASAKMAGGGGKGGSSSPQMKLASGNHGLSGSQLLSDSGSDSKSDSGDEPGGKDSIFAELDELALELI